jgi:hypothetical protein
VVCLGVAISITASPPMIVDDKTGSGKKKKKKKEKKKGEEDTPEVTPPAQPSAPPASAPPLKASPAPSATLTAPSTPSSKPSAIDAISEVKSRDELLDHLLAMGFAEADCLAAISACGLNVDMSISWLCDRPANAPTPPSQKSSKPASSNLSDAKDSGKKGPVVPAKNPSTPLSVSAPPPPPPDADALLKAQKDKEHKEELRRINRAWNARVPQQRAEEERKKVIIVLLLWICSYYRTILLCLC